MNAPNITQAKRYIGTAETELKRADREWAYYKNGSPYPPGSVYNDTPEYHFLASQKAYASAKKFAEKALEIVKGGIDPSIEERAKKIIMKCEANKK